MNNSIIYCSSGASCRSPATLNPTLEYLVFIFFIFLFSRPADLLLRRNAQRPEEIMTATKYGSDVQKVSADTPVEDIIYLLKRDGGVFVKGLISVADVDKAFEECRARLESDVEWNGRFFPSM